MKSERLTPIPVSMSAYGGGFLGLTFLSQRNRLDFGWGVAVAAVVEVWRWKSHISKSVANGLSSYH